MSIATVFTAVVGALSSPIANATGNVLTAANTGMNIAELNKLKKIQAGINSANTKLICIDRGQKDLVSQIDEFVDCIDDVVDFPANIQPGQPQPVTSPVTPTVDTPSAPPATTPANPDADEMARMWAAINRLAAGGAVAPTPTPAAPVAPVAEAPTTPAPAAAPAATPTATPAPAAVVNVGTAAPTAAPVAAPVEYATKEDLNILVAQIQSMAGSVNTLTDSLEKLTAATVALDAAAGESAPPTGGKPKK